MGGWVGRRGEWWWRGGRGGHLIRQASPGGREGEGGLVQLTPKLPPFDLQQTFMWIWKRQPAFSQWRFHTNTDYIDCATCDFWMKPLLVENVNGWNRFWMKVYWSCKEMCGAILWVSQQDDTTTLQSICSLHRWPPLQRRRNEICWRIVTSVLPNFWNACTWHELDDLIFYGQRISLHDRLRNGPKPVTNTWIDWFHLFITHVNTNSIVMWVILLNNADWDCSRLWLRGRSWRFEIDF